MFYTFKVCSFLFVDENFHNVILFAFLPLLFCCWVLSGDLLDSRWGPNDKRENRGRIPAYASVPRRGMSDAGASLPLQMPESRYLSAIRSRHPCGGGA